MSPRRSKLDIHLEVLKAVRKGVDKPTRIMYAVNISWNPVRKILDSLVDKGLLSVNENIVGNRVKRRFEITERGISVLTFFNGAKELVDIL